MKLTREEIDYRTITGAVIPRPIAWVSTRSKEDVDNIAPFSFFNVATHTPPTLMFSISRYDPEKPDYRKDTLVNVKDTGEFVVNVVTSSKLDIMNETSARLPKNEDEFEYVGVETEASELVSPKRVADTPISFECVLNDIIPIGESSLVLGDIVFAHIDDAVTTENKLDVRKVDALGRLTGGFYSPITERIKRDRP